MRFEQRGNTDYSVNNFRTTSECTNLAWSFFRFGKRIGRHARTTQLHNTRGSVIEVRCIALRSRASPTLPPNTHRPGTCHQPPLSVSPPRTNFVSAAPFRSGAHYPCLVTASSACAIRMRTWEQILLHTFRMFYSHQTLYFCSSLTLFSSQS